MRNRNSTYLLALLALSFAACSGGGPLRAKPGTRIRAALSADSVVQFSNGDTMTVTQATRDFYRKRRFRAAWVKRTELTDEGKGLFNAIGNADADGLDPRQYHYGTAQQLAKAAGAAEDDSAKAKLPLLLGELDIVLTEGMNRYANDLARGAVDPKASGLEWRIPREHAPEQSILDALVKGRSAQEIVDNLRPHSVQYRRFMTALARYRALEAKGVQWPNIPSDASLKPGQSDPVVRLLRQRMANSPDPTEAQLAAAGNARPDFYDPQLAQAVEHFQERHAIEPDGALGSTTVRELNHSLADRIDELRLNMDRWRWLPHDLGTRYVMVNVAGFELEVVDNGKVVENMNVVVGQENWNTPIFMDTMEYIVVNPSWNVPKSIMEKEIGPAMANDPNYLARNNMEMTSDGTVRQLPGDDNALGKFKFMFPNDDNIYLHDTPAKSLFSRTRRDFSHGCIRLERPRQLADLLASQNSKTTRADIDRLLASGQEQWIKFDRKLPVYILYFTAWVQEDGTVRFHHDVYGRDEQLERQTQRKLT